MLGDPGAVRRDGAIISGERCFRAKVYFKRETAFSVISLLLFSIEKIYQNFNTVFDHSSKHLEVDSKMLGFVFLILFLVFGNVVVAAISCF